MPIPNNARPRVRESARAFGQLATGSEFFDPESGEDWRKVDDTQAECLTGGDAFAGERDTFAPTDSVSL